MKQIKYSWLLGIVMVVALVLSACGAPAAPEAPAEEAAAPAPAEEEATGPAELPQIVPIEGPEVILDPAMFPTEFSEAPMLAEMVAAGELPPVAERLPDPEDIYVIKPLNEIGKYGGTWRRGFTGPADGENLMRINSSSRLLTWDYSASMIIPSLIKDWEINEDHTQYTLHLRRGAKWSDGHPLTAEDILFWYEDVALNEEIWPTPPNEMVINGEVGLLEEIDDFTVRWTFASPYPLFLDILAGHNAVGVGPDTEGAWNGGGYMPKHYMSQFLPAYSSEAEVTAKAEAEGFDSWLEMFSFMAYLPHNPDVPTMGPWKTVTPVNEAVWSEVRNPYYWAVDTEGNQLPYIDEIVVTLAQDSEVLALRAIAGEYDNQARHISISKLPVFLENMEKGNYRIDMSRAFFHNNVISFNHSYDGDAEIQKLIQNRDFRRALSMGIRRDQINEAIFLGLGVPGSAMIAASLPSTPGEEYVTKWATFDPDQANALLDSIGLEAKDDEGWRLRPDGSGDRLRIELAAPASIGWEWDGMLELVKDHWTSIGIFADLKIQERSLFETESRANNHQLAVWTNGGSSALWLYPRHVLPVNLVEAYMGPDIARWYNSGGEEGMAPPYPEMEHALDLFRQGYGVGGDERNKLAQEIWSLVVDEVWQIGTVGQGAGIAVTSNNMGNVPRNMCPAQHCRTPATSQPPTYYFKE